MCLLRYGGVWLTPERALDLIWDTLGQDKTYREMRRRKSRCIRLIYARHFNIDITPGVPQTPGRDAPLFVPDHELRIWLSSHPVGFADWFAKEAEATPILITAFSAHEGRTASNASVEPLREHGAFDKTPLQRIAQLLKRDRDEHFRTDLDHSPSSILLTTLTARSYSEEVLRPTTRLIDFVISVIEGLHRWIAIESTAYGSQYSVVNPVNVGENFAEKWNKAHYDAFRAWQRGLLQRLRAVANAKGQGLDVMLTRLSEGFGEEPVIAAANALGADTSFVHQAGRLRVTGATGLVGTAGSSMDATVYHGG
jgi:hypothetical protein